MFGSDIMMIVIKSATTMDNLNSPVIAVMVFVLSIAKTRFIGVSVTSKLYEGEAQCQPRLPVLPGHLQRFGEQPLVT